MAIVYKHYRKDNNQLFYIGIGKDSKRAYSTKKRNDLWQNIINKYGYYVGIHIENISYENAKKIEIELIKKYGRIDNGTGILSNMTNGGDHRLFSLDTKNKISNSLKGKKQTEETKIKRIKKLKEIWSNPALIELKRKQTKDLIQRGILKTRLGIASPNKNKPFPGDKIKLSDSLKKYYQSNEIHNKKHISVAKFDIDGNFIKKYDSHHEAAKDINGFAKRILDVCNCKLKSHKNYKWKYNYE